MVNCRPKGRQRNHFEALEEDLPPMYGLDFLWDGYSFAKHRDEAEESRDSPQGNSLPHNHFMKESRLESANDHGYQIYPISGGVAVP